MDNALLVIHDSKLLLKDCASQEIAKTFQLIFGHAVVVIADLHS
jgi:hypothetical protein